MVMVMAMVMVIAMVMVMVMVITWGVCCFGIRPVENAQSLVTLYSLPLQKSLCLHLVWICLPRFLFCSVQPALQFTHLCSQSSTSCLMLQARQSMTLAASNGVIGSGVAFSSSPTALRTNRGYTSTSV